MKSRIIELSKVRSLDQMKSYWASLSSNEKAVALGIIVALGVFPLWLLVVTKGATVMTAVPVGADTIQFVEEPMGIVGRAIQSAFVAGSAGYVTKLVAKGYHDRFESALSDQEEMDPERLAKLQELKDNMEADYSEAKPQLDLDKLSRDDKDPYDYLWTYDGEITEDQAKHIQTEAGYHPSGYSFHDYKVADGKTTWTSYNKCS